MKGDGEGESGGARKSNSGKLNNDIKMTRRGFIKASAAFGAAAVGIGVSHKYLGDLIETMDEDRIAIEMPDVPSKEVKAKAFDVKEAKDRLKAFADVEPKSIIYTGDFISTLTMKLCDEVYGRENYTIAHLILPSFDRRLIKFASEKIKDRNNVVKLIITERTCIPGQWNSCMWRKAVEEYHDKVGGLRIISCVSGRAIIRKFSDRTGPYFGEKIENGNRKVVLLLYYGFDRNSVGNAYYSLFPEEHDTWDYWRADACSIGIARCAFELGRIQRLKNYELWKEYKGVK